MNRKKKKFVDLNRTSVVHLNVGRGYIACLECQKEGRYRVRGIILQEEEE